MTIDRAAPAAVRETHTATVFLTGDRAYKVKKPVDLGFLDFRTRAARRAACHREVELNRRFAPDVYLGVADVKCDGQLADHLVVMRRMPDDRRLSTLVRQGKDVRPAVEALARVMAGYHARADRGTAISAQGSKKALAQRWEDSFAAVAAVDCVEHEVLARITVLVRDFLAGRDALFAGRIAEGRIVDGHGDLLADDIFWLDDGPRVLDCLEFDDRLRWLDGLDDICFLAMDLEHLGAPGAAALLIARYLEFCGDHPPASLQEHYLAYRAFVRAKVASLRHDQDGAPESAQLARDHADLALQHLRRGQVELVVVGGLPGTGKTTVAGRIADRRGAVLLSSDRIRKELAGFSPTEHRASAYRTGIYSGEHTELVYDELLHRAEALLGRGESVVVDASWITAPHRERAAELARRTHTAWRPVRCTAPTNVIIDRLRGRTDSLSDADVSVMSAMAVEMDPWPDATVVRTTGTAEAAATAALADR